MLHTRLFPIARLLFESSLPFFFLAPFYVVAVII